MVKLCVGEKGFIFSLHFCTFPSSNLTFFIIGIFLQHYKPYKAPWDKWLRCLNTKIMPVCKLSEAIFCRQNNPSYRKLLKRCLLQSEVSDLVITQLWYKAIKWMYSILSILTRYLCLFFVCLYHIHVLFSTCMLYRDRQKPANGIQCPPYDI